MSNNKNASKNYRIMGMHCASCAVLIEKEISKTGTFENIYVSRKKNTVTLTLKNEKDRFPTIEKLNSVINPFGYEIKSSKDDTKSKRSSNVIRIENGNLVINKQKFGSILFVLVGLLIVFSLYKIFERLGIVSIVNINENSGISVFFLFGLIAGFSSCFALVGSIVLSMSKNWYDAYKTKNTTLHRMYPHLLFNLGRLVSFFILGGLLGLLGDVLSISETFISVISITIATLIILTGLNLLGFKIFSDIKIPFFKIFKNDSSVSINPFLIGLLTFFVPCGFTLTAQGIAIMSSDFIQGALIMLIFALGTTPALLLVGFSTTKFYGDSNLSKNFSKLVAILIIIFGLFTINLQLVRLGLPSFNDLKFQISQSSKGAVSPPQDENLPPIVDGKQIVKSQATAYAYLPETIYLKKGIPVRWEITDMGTSGCTNAIIAKDFFEGRINLTPGETSVKEFTPKEAGSYRYSCWMGMVWGTIIVVN